MTNIGRVDSPVNPSMGHNSQDPKKLFQLQYEIEEALAQQELASLVGMARFKACVFHGIDAGAKYARANKRCDVVPMIGILIAILCDNDEGQCTISESRLARVLGRQRTTISEAMARIEKTGHFSITPRIGRTSIYTIKPNKAFGQGNPNIVHWLDALAPYRGNGDGTCRVYQTGMNGTGMNGQMPRQSDRFSTNLSGQTEEPVGSTRHNLSPDLSQDNDICSTGQSSSGWESPNQQPEVVVRAEKVTSVVGHHADGQAQSAEVRSRRSGRGAAQDQDAPPRCGCNRVWKTPARLREDFYLGACQWGLSPDDPRRGLGFVSRDASDLACEGQLVGHESLPIEIVLKAMEITVIDLATKNAQNLTEGSSNKSIRSGLSAYSTFFRKALPDRIRDLLNAEADLRSDQLVQEARLSKRLNGVENGGTSRNRGPNGRKSISELME